jgi:hypothetical protein
VRVLMSVARDACEATPHPSAQPGQHLGYVCLWRRWGGGRGTIADAVLGVVRSLLVLGIFTVIRDEVVFDSCQAPPEAERDIFGKIGEYLMNAVQTISKVRHRPLFPFSTSSPLNSLLIRLLR